MTKQVHKAVTLTLQASWTHITTNRYPKIRGAGGGEGHGDFPGGPLVKNRFCNAGDTGSIPGWGTKIPHAAGQLLNLCTASNEPAGS